MATRSRARLYVNVPAPTPARYGLVASAVTVDATDPHFRNGVMFEPLSCEAAGVTVDGCHALDLGGEDPLYLEDEALEAAKTKTASRGVSLVESDPFTVYRYAACSAPSRNDALLRDRVTSELALGEGRAIESAFWTMLSRQGMIPPDAFGPWATQLDTPWPEVEVITEDPVLPIGGLAGLESAMGECYGGEPYFHVPRGAIPALVDTGYIHVEGNRLRTILGGTVVAGAGYQGTAPGADFGDSPPPGVAWIYATGSTFVWRGPIEVVASDLPEHLDRGNNDSALIAERTVVVAYDCCAFAIPITISGFPYSAPEEG